MVNRVGSMPALASIRDVSAHIAVAVAEVAYARRLTAQRKPANLLAYIRSQMYAPTYPTYA